MGAALAAVDGDPAADWTRLADGYTTNEIATELGTSPSSISARLLELQAELERLELGLDVKLPGVPATRYLAWTHDAAPLALVSQPVTVERSLQVIGGRSLQRRT